MLALDSMGRLLLPRNGSAVAANPRAPVGIRHVDRFRYGARLSDAVWGLIGPVLKCKKKGKMLTIELEFGHDRAELRDSFR